MSALVDQYFGLRDDAVVQLMAPPPEVLAALDTAIEASRSRYARATTTTTAPTSSTTSTSASASSSSPSAAPAAPARAVSHRDVVDAAAFDLGVLLVSHTRRESVDEGLGLMESLVFRHWREYVKQCGGAPGEVPRLPPNPKGTGSSATTSTNNSNSNSATNSGGGSAEAGKTQVDQEALQARRLLAAYLYYVAIARCKRQEYDMAHAAAHKMLLVVPNDPQAGGILRYVEKQQTKDGVVGLAGIAAVAGAGIFTAVALGAKLFAASRRQ